MEHVKKATVFPRRAMENGCPAEAPNVNTEYKNNYILASHSHFPGMEQRGSLSSFQMNHARPRAPMQMPSLTYTSSTNQAYQSYQPFAHKPEASLAFSSFEPPMPLNSSLTLERRGSFKAPDFETTEGEAEDLYDKLMAMAGWTPTVPKT